MGICDDFASPSECRPIRKMKVSIASVVIPTRNRARAVESCLDALAAQTLPAGSFEVIAVDDGSEPPLTLDPKRWTAKFELKVIRQNNTGPAGARNRGVAEARGEFVAFTDDDCLPTPTWLANLLTALRATPQALVGGSTFNGLPDDVLAATSQLIVDLVYERFNTDRNDSYFFTSNNVACSRNNLLTLGGFDTDFAKAGAEDRDFCDRWRIHKWPLIWAESALIEHRHAQGLREFLTLYFRYGQGAFLYQAKRRSRGSGTMKEDLGFHASLAAQLVRRGKDLGTIRFFALLLSLLAWQLANATGFAWAAVTVRSGTRD